MRYIHLLLITTLILLLLSGNSAYCQQVSTSDLPTELLKVRMPAKKTGSLKPVKILGNQAETSAPVGSISVNEDPVYNAMSPTELVQKAFIKGCLTADNVKFGYYKKIGSNWIWIDHSWNAPATRQMGYFKKETSTFPIDEGIILTTGSAATAMGPNSTGNMSEFMVLGASDPDLSAISGQDMNDAAVLEFDFVPAGNTMEFKYLFSSEEYLEYVNTAFNDAFGFFLSGPGISGTYKNNAVNLAVLPNGDPVTINTIHPAGINIADQAFAAKNEAYYLDNPPYSLTYQYDGGTVLLTATYSVVPCQTYHIKLSVADAYDQEFDGAVFLAANSFNSDNLVLTNYGNAISGMNNVFEGCSNSFRIQRTDADLSHDLDLDLILSGTATNGVDIKSGNQPFPNHVTIPKNATYVDIPYTAVADGVPDNDETFIIDIATSCPCAANVVYVRQTINIYEQFVVNSISSTDALCYNQSSGTITVNSAGGSGRYSYSINNGTSWQSRNVFSNLAPGNYTVIIKDIGSCFSGTSNPITIGNPAPIVADAGSGVAICSGQSTQLNGSGGNLYTWSPTAGLSATNIANPVATPLTTTIYTLVATNTLGSCPSTANVTVTVNPSPVAIITPANPTICNGSTITLTASGGDSYTWNPGGETTAAITVSPNANTSYTVTALAVNGCSNTALVNLVVKDAPAMYDVTGGGTICAGSAGVIVGLSGSQTGVNYQLKLNGLNLGIVISGNGSSLSFGNQNQAGTYTISANMVSTSCVTVMNGNAIVVVNPTSVAPSIFAITQPTCSLATGSVVLSGLPAGNWIINPGNIAGSGTSIVIPGVAAGTYNYSVTNSFGCVSSLSANAVVNVQPVTPSTPAIGTVTQTTCSISTGSVVLTGLPAGNWTINPGAIAGTGASKTISGLVAGTYNYSVANSVGCISALSENIIINTQPVTPTALIPGAITQPTCATATGSVELSGLPSGNWTINPVNQAGNTASTILSGLSAGTYNFTVTNSVGCISPASSNIVITAVIPTSPLVGTIIQPTCTVATGSVLLSNLPAGNWTINPGGINGNTASITISGLSTGTYNYAVTNNLGCSSAASANVVINAQPLTPPAPTPGTITQPTCSLATGSIVLTGLPTGNWTINPGVLAGTGASNTLSGLAAGTYAYTVTNSVGCVSALSANVVINAQPVTPTAPTAGAITQPTCTVSTGSAVLNGLPVGNWIINPGAIAGTGASTTMPNLNTGTYNFTVTNAAGCTSAASANIVINTQPLTPTAPAIGTITQPTCTTATGGVVITGLPVGTWTINPGAISGAGASTAISGLVTGTYTYSVTNATGCISAMSEYIIINAQPITPTAPVIGAITQPTCSVATGSVVLSGLPSGTWTINPGAISGSGAITTVSSISSGIYTFTVTNASGCISPISANVIINAQPVTPPAPTVGANTPPTCSLSTGSVILTGLPAGAWTIDPGAITGSGTSTTLSGLATGTYSYNITNAAGCISSFSANIIIIAQPATPSVPVVGTITHPTCASSTGSVDLSGLPAGTWTINPGAIVGTGSSKTVSGLAAGTYNYTVTNASGCVSAAASSVVINPQPAIPSAPVAGTVTQPTCFTAIGSIQLTGLPAGNWILNPGAIAGNTATTTFLGLVAGSYAYTVTNSVGCSSSVSANIIINSQPATPTTPTVGTITQPTCTVATGSVVLNGLPAGTWVINPGAIAGSGASKTISGLATGTYNFTVTSAAGCISPVSTDVIINAQPITSPAPTIGSLTQTSCSVSTGSVILNGLPAGAWTINPGAIAGSGASVTFSGMSAGTYTYTVTNLVGCISPASANVIINTQPVTPSAPALGAITQPDCSSSTGSIVLTGLPAGSWTINPGAIAGSGTSKTISGLAAGTYSFTVTSAAGCISPSSANVVINAHVGTPSAPILDHIIQATCAVATGSIVLIGLPAGNWVVNPGAIAGTGNTLTISGLIAGTYNYTVTNSVGCTSLPSTNIVINTNPGTPAIPVISSISQPSCTVATGSVTLVGLPVGNWTINPGGITGSGVTTTISGLLPGTYNYTVTTASGCISLLTVDAVINSQPLTPATPITGAITQPTCVVSTGSVDISGLPAGNWIINPGAYTGSGASTTVSGLVAGTYQFTVTNSVGCTSLPAASITITAATPTAPAVGVITHPTCTVATGNVILNGLPAGNWTIKPGAIAGSGVSTTISGLTVGTHSYTVTNAMGCTSLASANVVINAQPATPVAPVVGALTQPTCTVATGSVVMSGLPAGNWTINPGSFAGTGSSTIVSGIASGSYNFTVTNAAGCTSPATANVIINAQPVTPGAPTVSATQPGCAVATGSILLTGLPAGNWTINPGAVTASGASKTFSGLLAGTYTYTVTNAVGCTSLPSVSTVINNDPGTPSAPIVSTITHPSCGTSTGSVLLTGLPVGNWSINPGAIAGNTPNATLSGLATGTYNFTVTNAGGCISLPSAAVIINLQPITPSAPIPGATAQPTCAVATGSVVLSGLPAGTWTINPGAVTSTGASRTITGLATGTYAFTVTNSVGCVSLPSTDVIINVQPLTPAAPAAGTITQPTCSVATGSIELTGLPAGNWTINPGAITGNTASTTLSGISAGNHTYTVTNSVGCSSPSSTSIVINAQPVTPSAPAVSSITQPTCTLATGSVLLGGLPTGTWTLNPGAIAGNTATATLSGLATATYNYTVTNAAGCTSPATVNIVINAQPVTPSAPTTGTFIQPTCTVSTGSVTINDLPAGNWTINPGAVAGTGTSKTISGIATGTYTYTVTNSVGCISPASSSVIINAQPITPSAPTVSSITQPSCSVATGNIDLSGLPAGNWTLNPGLIVGNTSITNISGLVAGTYTFSVTNSIGCTSSASVAAVINTQPSIPSAPVVGTITQPSCTVATGSVILNSLPAGTWTINPGGITGIGTSKTISGLATGTYNFRVTSSAGCNSPASADVVINIQPVTPSAPDLGLISQPTCSVSTGNIVLTGLPASSWTVNPGAIAGTGNSVVIPGIASGSFAYTVTNDLGCISAAVNVIVDAQPLTPSAPAISTITQPTCTVATGSTLLTGLPAGAWTINPGALSGSGTSTTISGLATGSYNYTVTNVAGCSSGASANIVINTQPATPSAPINGLITQPTCSVSTGSVALGGLPAGLWTINPGAISGSGAGTTISGLTTGSHTFTVTNAAGCTSAASVIVIINSQPVTPSAPIVSSITQPSCSVATGGIQLSGLPSGNWTINPGAISGNTASYDLTGLNAGTYSYTVSNSVGCISLFSTSPVINSQPTTPIAPTIGTITQPTCASATGSVVLGNLPTGSWTINPGAITGTGSNKTIAGLAAGTYAYTVTNSAGCISTASANVIIDLQPITPSAPLTGSITQPTCALATGSSVLSGLPAGNWTINPGAITGAGPSATISGITSGTYSYTVTNSVGCSSSSSAAITINLQPATPAIPVVSSIIQPTCAVSNGSAKLSGLPSGNWTINPGSIAGTGAATTLSGLTAGTHNYTVTNAVGCISGISADVVINSQPVTPSTPSIGLITQPDCSSATGSVEIGGLPAGTWTINPGAISGSVSNTTLSGLASGTYNFTVTNADGCTAIATTDVVINVQPATPTPPIVTLVSNPTCVIATGSLLLSGLPVGNWTINPGAITGNTTSTTITGLDAGAYTFTVTNSAGCTSSPSIIAIIDPQPAIPATPVASTVTQPTCSFATGSIVLSNLPPRNWIINPGAITGNASSITLSGLTAGTYSYTITKLGGCTSAPTVDIVINPQPVAPPAPTIGAITQPACSGSKGTIQITAPTGTGMSYSIDGSDYTNNTGIFALLNTGNYNITAKSSAGCISTGTSATINTPPAAIVFGIPAVTKVSCTGSSNGVIQIIATNGTGSILYSINPNTATQSPAGKFNNLTAQSYTITATDGNGCTLTTDVTVGTVPDITLPTITCPANVAATTNTGCTATGVALGTPVTSDNCGVASVTNDAPVAFPLGGTTVKWTVTDNSGNKASCNQTVTVTDNVLPTITCPANVNATTNSGCTATGVALGTPVTADNCGVASVTNNAPAAFPLGATTVKWTVTDNSGNKASCNQTVTVTDNVLPTITCPANVTATTNTGCTATGVALGSPVTTDNCGVASVTNDAPAVFPIGLTTVIWKVTDNSGNFATSNQTVTVSDNVLPTITCPTNVTATTNTGCTATGVALGTPVTSDNCGVASVTNDAPAAFPLGGTTVKWTVTDNSGNKAFCNQTVTVTDNVLPTITCPVNVNATTNSGCTATGVALGTPVTADNCGVASVTNNAPAAFPLGATTVKWTVTDNSGNKAFCNQTVTVTDNVLPTITSPVNVTATTNTGCTAIGVALGTPVTADNCGVASVTNNAPAVFPIGLTTVTWKVTDNSGNFATSNQTVTVSDNVLPTITCPTNVTATTNTGCTATGVALGTPVTSDNCGVASVTNDAPAAFPLGVTTVKWTVTDNSGNKAFCNQTVTVTDNVLPTIACPVNINATTNSGCTATGIALGTPVTADNCGVATVTNNAPAIFPLGVTTVKWTVTDNSGNKASCNQTVTVTDNVPPNITCPANVTTITNTGCTATGVDLGTLATSDNCGVASVTNNAPAVFPIGLTTVTWKVTDNSGNFATCNQTVIVSDNILPTITCPTNVTATTNTGCTATGVALGTPVTSDNCGVASVTNDAPAAFPIGITTVKWTVTDNSGNKAFCNQTVTVTDNINPTITCPANVTATTNSGCTATGVALGTPVTADNCGVASVTNNAPAIFPLGVTTVKWTVTDNSGNKAFCNQTVTVTDNILPTITCPANITAITNTGCTATGVDLGTPATSDNCGVASVTNDAPAIFPIGLTTVKWTVTDNSGNKAFCNQTVTITDNVLPIITCPANVNATTNTGCTATGVALGIPVTSDNCGVASVTNNAPVAFPIGITTVKWTVTDNSGNKAFCEQTVTVTDSINPTITCPANVTATTNTGCTATGVALGTPVTADNCGVASVTNNAPAAFPIGLTIVTWKVTDNSGNFATCSQTVTVSDNVLPILACPANVTATTNTGCAATGVALGTPVTSDNCGVASVTNNAPAVFPIGLTTVTWKVTDNSGNFATCNQTVIVSDNILPTITCPTNVTATTNTGCTATGVALGTPVTADNCGVASVTNDAPAAFPIGITTVKWTVTDNSGNKAFCNQTVTVTDNINPTITCPANVTATTNTGCTATGVALGTPVTADNCGVASVTNNAPAAFPIGVTTVTWKVTDNSGNFATCNQTVTVSDNLPPTIICPANLTVNANVGLSYATGVNIGVPITADNCGVASVSNNAPVQFPIGSTNVIWTVADIHGLTTTCTQIITVSDTQSPIMNCPATITVECINEVPAAFANLTAYEAAGGTATDNDGIVAASFALVSQISNGLTCPEVITRIYTVADVNNNFGTCSQLIIVDDKTKPVLTNFPADITVECNAVPVPATLTATDNCDASPTVTFAEVRTNGTCPNSYTLTRTWTAKDACSNTSSKTQIITVQDNTAPILSAAPANVTVECNAVPAAAVLTATDNCDAAPTVTFAEVRTDGTCPNSYTLTRTWTAKDACANTSSKSQSITVQDNTAPVLSSAPANVTVDCTSVPVAAVLTATDNCDAVPTVTFAEVRTDGTCPNSYTLTRTWTAKDACANTSSKLQIITVNDVTAPILSAAPANVTVECTSVPVAAVLTATDNCDAAPMVTYDEVRTDGTCPNSYTLTRTWTAKDACANTSSKSQIITVKDVTAPILSAAPASTTVECNAIPVAATLTATDNCDATPVVTFTEIRTDGTCPDSYTLTRTWTAKDACANTSSKSQIITVRDVTAPVLSAAPANITVECNAIPAAAVLTATDNCDASPTVTYVEIRNDGTCPNSYTLTRTWTAKDACANASSKSQIITVQDVTAPVLSAAPADVTVECNSVPVAATLTATDNCDATPLVTFAEVRADGTCPNSYTLTRTWTAKDACANISSTSQVITVQDVTAPVLSTVPANVTVECNAVPTAATLTATDNCDATPLVTFAEVRTDGTCPNSYTLTRTWIAKDVCGNTSSKSQVITVQDVTAPVITCPGSIVVQTDPGHNTAYVTNGAPAITDNCGTFTFINSFNNTNNASGTYPLGVNVVTWSATDACGNTSSCQMTVTVSDTEGPAMNCPPTINESCINDVPAAYASLAEFIAAGGTATDNDGINATSFGLVSQISNGLTCPEVITRTYNVADLNSNFGTCTQLIIVDDKIAPVFASSPSDVTVECNAVPAAAILTATDNCDADPVVTFKEVRTDGTCPNSYTLTRTWTAKDACANTTSVSQIITVQEVTAPVLSAAPANAIVECNAVPVAATLTATDNCDATPVVTFAEVRTDGTCPNSYTLTRTWTAKDACANTSSVSQIITVQDVTAPILSAAPADATVECNAVPVAAILTATDNCDATPVVTFAEIRTDGTCPNSYTLTRTWTAKDACANSSFKNQVITVQDITAPVLSAAPANITVECNAVPAAATLTATDNCDATPVVTFAEVRTDGTCPNSYTLTRTWTAKDVCENTSSKSQIITVQDETAPIMSAAPANVTVECNAVPAAAILTATDNCDATPVVTYAEVRTDGTCPNSYTLTRTWTAKDVCGNTSSKSQIITVQDITAPVLSDAPANITVECNAVPVAAILTATDNCDALPVVTFAEVRTDGTCPNSYTLTRKWTATDVCGNNSSKSQIITVQDNTTPVISCPANITVTNDPGKCGATLTVPVPSATDNCSLIAITNNYNHLADASGIYPVGTTTLIWTAKDECGNTSTCEMTVTVNDTEKPAISCPSDVTICSGVQPVLGTATATDNCGIASITNNAPSTFVTGTTLVVWTATDIHGNTSTCTQTIIISPRVTVDAGQDESICFAKAYVLSKASATNYSSVSWTHNGHGSLSNSTILNPTYTPTAGEIGSVEFTLTAKGTSACGDVEISDKFVLTIYEAIIVNAGEDQTIISGTATKLDATAKGGTGVFSYTWSNGEFLLKTVELKTSTIPLNAETVFTLTIFDAISGCRQSDDVKINMNDVERPIARNDYDTTTLNTPTTMNVKANDSDPVALGLTVSITGKPRKGTAILNENGSITYTPQTGSTGNDTITYKICDKGVPSKCSTAIFVITIFPIRDAFEIYNLITPNGDGQNDFWYIGGIDEYPDNFVTIFNRWGDKVRDFKAYNNSNNRWDGTNDKGNLLPSGTYYYILTIPNFGSRTGWLMLQGKEQ